jgi:hypothetical protein
MNMQRSLRLPLAGAVALALFGTASIAAAQMQPPPPVPTPPSSAPVQPMQPPPPPVPMSSSSAPAPPSTMTNNQQPMTQSGQQQGSATQIEPATESSVSFKAQNGTSVTINSGMPAHVKQYGPPPSFKSLDTNHNGRISQSEAKAYPPLDSGFLFVSGGRKTISRAQYEKWAKSQFSH